jgi:hypothetical protein
LQDGADIINQSGRLSGEERFPGAQIIIRPEGEALPERKKRVRRARSTAGRASEAKKRLDEVPCAQNKTDYARTLITPNAILTPDTEVPTP